MTVVVESYYAYVPTSPAFVVQELMLVPFPEEVAYQNSLH
jgi:hypothetical protein